MTPPRKNASEQAGTRLPADLAGPVDVELTRSVDVVPAAFETGHAGHGTQMGRLPSLNSVKRADCWALRGTTAVEDEEPARQVRSLRWGLLPNLSLSPQFR